MTNVNIMWYVKKWIVSKEHEQDFDASNGLCIKNMNKT